MLSWLWRRLEAGSPEATISGRALRRFPAREVDRLLRARVLVERRKADTWPVCTHCDCGLDARPIREIGGQLLACCPHDAAEDEVLEPDDLQRFLIEADRLVGAIAASAGLVDSATRIGDGIWFLGVAPAGRGIVLCRDPDRLAAPGAILAMKAAAGGAPVIVIASAFAATVTLRLREAGIEAIALADVMATDGPGMDRLSPDLIIGKAKLGVPIGGDTEPATVARLQISRARRSVRLDGRDYILSLTEFDCFLGAADKVAAGQVMLTYQEIYALTNRASHRDVINEIRDRFQTQGLSRKQAFDLVRTVHGRGLTIGLPSHDIAIRD